MSVDGSSYSLTKFIVAAIFGMCLLATSVVLGVNFSVDHAVSIDARAKAEDWAKYFISTLPDLDRLLASGRLDDQQAQIVATAAKVGNIFRFKLYDSKGDTVLQSDAESFGKAGDSDHIDDEAFDVVATKEPMVSLNDGTLERDMPALYAEAYVPVLTPSGDLRTIVEVYEDQTKTAAFFKTSFSILAFGLAIATALAFGLPMLAFLLRTKQAREVKHRVEFLASHDPMTNLLNRASFAELLTARVAALPTGHQLAVVFLDVDDFKAINDNYGHEAGDAFLKHVAHAISSHCGADDFVARAGGDEFIAALQGGDAAQLATAIEAMAAAVREPIMTHGHRVSGRLSAGIYMITERSERVEDAMQHADIALYQAKIDGKNTVRSFSPDMEVRMRARRELEQLVRDAVAFGHFEIHYQPLIDVQTRSYAGYEALLRLRDKHGAYVPPMIFIPVAEEIGLISQIGKWVLEEATSVATLWPGEMFVSVNLSVRQFADRQLVENVEQALERAGLAPGRLELEVTETLLMENSESVATQLMTLKALGVSIAMDDFGTGYSSLGYLWQFGFDKLKIDRSFITALDVDEKKGREILDTIVMLGHKLEMTVTAEGIETEKQAAILASLGCDQFQGYLYGRPAPATEIAAQLLGQITIETRPPTRSAGAA